VHAADPELENTRSQRDASRRLSGAEGEFGLPQISPDEDYATWLNDYLAFFERFGIGWNWWNYSGGNIYRTGLVCGKKISPNAAILRKRIVKARRGRPLQRSR
jgi:hypothetical protein